MMVPEGYRQGQSAYSAKEDHCLRWADLDFQKFQPDPSVEAGLSLCVTYRYLTGRRDPHETILVPVNAMAKFTLLEYQSAEFQQVESLKQRLDLKHCTGIVSPGIEEERADIEQGRDVIEEVERSNSEVAEAGEPVDKAWLRNVMAAAQSNGRLAYRSMTEGASAAEMQEIITLSTEMSELAADELRFMRG